MRITKKVEIKGEDVLHILKVSENTFLIGGYCGSISLRNKNDLTLLTILHISEYIF